MLPRIAIWLATSKTGRAFAAAGALLVGIGAALLKVYSAGRAAERDRQDKTSLDNLRDRARLEDQLQAETPDQRRKRIEQWARDRE